jgi:DNA mismatch repair protein MutS
MDVPQGTTPLMQQYSRIKAEYPDLLLFFQVGDFYELFYHDAKTAASFLGIALTKRGKTNGIDIPLCGVPVSAIDHYLHKLIKGGYKVALCEQLEEPRPGTVVRRGVTRVLTPGMLTQEHLLNDKSSSYLCSLIPMPDGCGLLFGEFLTAQLFATYIPCAAQRSLDSEISRFFPDEIIVPEIGMPSAITDLKARGYCISPFKMNRVELEDDFNAWLQLQFTADMIRAIAMQEALRLAFFYFYAYVRRNNEGALVAFKSINFYAAEDFLQIDRMTQHNLELVSNAHDGLQTATIFTSIDGAVTSMGSRMIKKWLLRPLINHEAIVQRQEVVQLFVQEVVLQKKVRDLFSYIGDLERIIGRILISRAPKHDYIALKKGLEYVPHIKQELQVHTVLLPLLRIIDHHIGAFGQLYELLERSLCDEQSVDWIIRSGYNVELDAMRSLIAQGSQEMLVLEKSEQEKTGINSLKVRYNSVHGYYIEMTKLGSATAPVHYKRLQSLVGKERYTTTELELLALRIESAKNEITAQENALFEEVKKGVAIYATALRKLSHGLAHLDALSGLAQIAYEYGYTKPTLNQERIIDIRAGRHPVVERHTNGHFIANDVLLDDTQSTWIITGPNMGGKSTFLRQVASICILAHMGSFVPAKSANIALLDRVFTRIGAGDNVAGGKSTFLVEMEETAAICNYATAHSLVILDEVGRGTSTIDGRAIAQAVIEYLARQNGPRVLFATHYHELTSLHQKNSAIVPYYAASTKTAAGILFLYKIVRGVADGSFGIEVAKLADLPAEIIERAYELVQHYDDQHLSLIPDKERVATFSTAQLRPLVQPMNNSAILAEELRAIDLNNLTPLAAFAWLQKLQEKVKG